METFLFGNGLSFFFSWVFFFILTPTTVTIDVDTLQFYPFIYATNEQVPCVAVAAGSGIIPGTSTVTLEDAFDNRPLL